MRRMIRMPQLAADFPRCFMACIAMLLVVCAAPAWAQQKTFDAQDSLQVVQDADPQVEALLQKLRYEPKAFTVDAQVMPSDAAGRVMLRYETPAGLQGHETDTPGDQAMLIWHVARDEQGQPIAGPGVLIVHSMHPHAMVATMMANALSADGVHAFVIRMPGFRPRQRLDVKPLLAKQFPQTKDATSRWAHPAIGALTLGPVVVREVRRARDVIAAMPLVEGENVGAVGISLGAFALTVAAGLDDGFDPVFLFLGGADGVEVIETGIFDARLLRNNLEQLGLDAQARRTLLQPIQPHRVAHRLDAEHTWMISADADNIVRPDNAKRLAQAIGLDESHHKFIQANHYTSVLYLPAAADFIADIIKAEANTPPTKPTKHDAENPSP